jgi:hypothetical protein
LHKNNDIILINNKVSVFQQTLVIWCGNLNREKLSKEQTEFGVKPQKKSLEGRIRKWFDER